MCVVSVVGFSADTCDAWEYSFPFFLLLLFQPQGNSLAYLRLLRLFFHECHKLFFSKIQVQAKTDGFNPENVHEWEPHQLGQPGDPHTGSASAPTLPHCPLYCSLGLPARRSAMTRCVLPALRKSCPRCEYFERLSHCV